MQVFFKGLQRNLRIVQPQADIPCNGERWVASGAVTWQQDGSAQYTCASDRAWLRLRQTEAKSLNLKPGAPLTIEDVDLPRLQSFLTRYADALAAQNDRDLKT